NGAEQCQHQTVLFQHDPSRGIWMSSDRRRTAEEHAWGAMKHWNGPVTETRRTVFDFPWSASSITASDAGRPHDVHARPCRLQSPDAPMLPMSRQPRPLSPVA